MRKRLTEAQILLAEHLRELGFTNIVHEYRMSPRRRWRADIRATLQKMPGGWSYTFFFEADGGKWHGGHRRGNALEADYEKQNWAQVHGYKILRFTNQQIISGWAREWLKNNL